MEAEQQESAILTSTQTISTNQDSIRKLYQKKLAAKTKLLPEKQVLEAGKLYPVDEAQTDTSFFLFREDLLTAIQNKDIFSLVQHIDENIKCSFGDENGLSGFIKLWQLDSPSKTSSSPVWSTLEQVLNSGGTFDQDRQLFIAPYLYATFPDKYDSFEYGAITGSGVRLRTEPGLQSQTIKNVSYEIVKLLGPSDKTETIQGETHPWVQVELLDGTSGYVFGKFVGSPIDFRAGFERQSNDRWKMIFLVAGD